jgi:hypothetical protein
VLDDQWLASHKPSVDNPPPRGNSQGQEDRDNPQTVVDPLGEEGAGDYEDQYENHEDEYEGKAPQGSTGLGNNSIPRKIDGTGIGTRKLDDKTPPRPANTNGITSTGNPSAKSSLRHQNGDSIDLPEILTDPEDEDSEVEPGEVNLKEVFESTERHSQLRERTAGVQTSWLVRLLRSPAVLRS